jgi:hypothetical protein
VVKVTIDITCPDPVLEMGKPISMDWFSWKK